MNPIGHFTDKAVQFTPGKISRQFTVCCGMCEQSETLTCNSQDVFLSEIDKQWRVSDGRGWVHRKCLKMAPARIKL